MPPLVQQTLLSALPLLDLLPEPVLWIDPDYRVRWRNAEARRAYGDDSPYCYALTHGLDRPCSEAGESCPKAAAEESLTPVSQVHAHFDGNDPGIFRVLALPVESGGVLELHLALGTDLLRDELTGLFRREYWLEMAGRDRALLARLSRPWSLIFLDLDRFKDFNDTHGHLAGDELLRQAGRAISGCLRTSDSACRYGGDEMVVFLPDTETEAALEVAERIRVAIRGARVSTDPRDPKLTVSAGVYTARPQDSLEQAIEKVDEALYQAKATDRDTVECYVSPRTG